MTKVRHLRKDDSSPHGQAAEQTVATLMI